MGGPTPPRAGTCGVKRAGALATPTVPGTRPVPLSLTFPPDLLQRQAAAQAPPAQLGQAAHDRQLLGPARMRRVKGVRDCHKLDGLELVFVARARRIDRRGGQRHARRRVRHARRGGGHGGGYGGGGVGVWGEAGRGARGAGARGGGCSRRREWRGAREAVAFTFFFFSRRPFFTPRARSPGHPLPASAPSTPPPGTRVQRTSTHLAIAGFSGRRHPQQTQHTRLSFFSLSLSRSMPPTDWTLFLGGGASSAPAPRAAAATSATTTGTTLPSRLGGQAQVR